MAAFVAANACNTDICAYIEWVEDMLDLSNLRTDPLVLLNCSEVPVLPAKLTKWVDSVYMWVMIAYIYFQYVVDQWKIFS